MVVVALPRFVHLQVIFIIPCPAAYPSTCALSDEIIKGPQLRLQFAVVPAPDVRLCFDGPRQLTDRCKRGRGSRDDEAIFFRLGASRGVSGNGRKRAKWMDEHIHTVVVRLCFRPTDQHRRGTKQITS